MNKVKNAELRELLGTAPHLGDSHAPLQILRGCEGIEVDSITHTENPYKGMFEMAVATWGSVYQGSKWENASPQTRFVVVDAVLRRQALPLALESPQFVFEIKGASRSSFDQIARARIGVTFAGMGTRDNCHADIPFRCPTRIYDDRDQFRIYQAAVRHSLQAYRKLVDIGQSDWQNARSVLPASACYRYQMAINYAALQNLCSKRLMACTPSGQEIISENGVIDIENVIVGDRIVTDKGRLQTVTRLHRRQYHGDLVELKIFGHYGRHLRLTPDHPILAVKRRDFDQDFGSDRWRQITNRDAFDANRQWIPVGELETGDVVALSIPAAETIGEIDLTEFYCPLRRHHPNDHSHELIGKIALTYDLGRLAGFYLSEGSCGQTNVSFAFGKTDAEVVRAEEIVKIASVFGTFASVKKRTDGCVRVTLYSPQFAAWLRSTFGHGSLEKKIPYWTFGAPREYLDGLWSGWIEGDGIPPGYGTSSSRNLIYGMRDVAHVLGYAVGIVYRKATDDLVMGRTVATPRPKWTLQANFETGIASKGRRWWRTSNYVYYLVRSVERQAFDGEVFNFDVEGDHSYNMIQASSHNCEQEDTVATAWLLRDALWYRFPLLASHLRPGCDIARRCTYHANHGVSEAFGALFRGCGRWPSPVDEEFAIENHSCTEYGELAHQIHVHIPWPTENIGPATYEELAEVDTMFFEGR